MRFLLSVSKITPPRFPHIIHRTRLISLLQQNSDKKLILILGPAAQGKSALAVTWVNISEMPSAWLNLEPEASDSVNLFYLLLQALEQALPSIDFSVLLGYPALAMGPREEIPLYRNWVLALYDLVSFPVLVIFDGLDQIITNASAFRFLQVLLDEAPPGFHFILLSREMPQLNLQPMRMRQEVFILTGKELAFSVGEISEFLKIRQFSLSLRSVKQIHRLTEGWVGGLVLLWEELARLPETTREEYLTDDLTEKFKGDVFNYFGEQIFASLPPSKQDFLIGSSILEEVDPDFVKDFLGVEQPLEILEDLARRNLFIDSIYEKERGWIYRYHLLFRDFLRFKFKTVLAEEQQRATYHRAGEQAAQRGQLQEAVNYYLQAQDYKQAISVIRKIGLGLLRLGKNTELTQWLQTLPPNLKAEDPWMLFFGYMTRRFSGSPEDIFDLLRARTLFEQQMDWSGSILSLANLMEASVTRGHPAITPLDQLLDQAEALLKSLPSTQYIPEKAILWFQMGFSSYMRGGNPQGLRACQQAYLLARNLDDIPLQISALASAIGSLASLGEFARAERMIQQAEKLLAKCPYEELQAMLLCHFSHYYWYKGDLKKMAEVLHCAREKAEKHGLTYLYPIVRFYDLSLKLNLGEFQEAEEICGVLTGLTSVIGNSWFHGITLMLLGVTNYRKGDFLKAKEALQSAQEILSSPESRAYIHLTFIKILLAMVAYHLHENGEVEKGLKEALDQTRDIGSFIFIKEVFMALALLKWQQGHLQEAARHLQEGLKLAQEHSHDITIILNREDLLKICILALDLGLKEVWDYVTHLLATRLADLADPELEKLLSHHDKRVTERAWEIRRAVHRGKALLLRIQTLGSFRLWRGEVPMEEPDWEGHQPQLLLKTILAHGARGVIKDVLLENLWPEANPESAEKNFKVNLHRLRKSLEPNLDKTFGSNYIHLKANLVSLDPELCELDVEKFLALIKEGEKKENQGQLRQAISLYKEAVEFYGGDFLPEELYSTWVEAKRAEIRDKYSELLHRLGGLYEKQGALTKAIDCYKKAANVDPLDETTYQRLMLLHAQRSKRSAALKVYQDCCQVLKKELNAEPDKVTTAIYQKILAFP